jgi:hypothetical protein
VVNSNTVVRPSLLEATPLRHKAYFHAPETSPKLSEQSIKHCDLKLFCPDLLQHGEIRIPTCPTAHSGTKRNDAVLSRTTQSQASCHLLWPLHPLSMAFEQKSRRTMGIRPRRIHKSATTYVKYRKTQRRIYWQAK